MISFMFLSITEHNHRLINSLRAIPAFLVLLMLCRVILFWLSSGDTDPGFSLTTGFWILFNGLRFDALILGFVYLPLYFLSWVFSLRWIAIYLKFTWLIIVILNFINLHFFMKHGTHRYWSDHLVLEGYVSDAKSWWINESLVTALVLILIYLLIFGIGHKTVSDLMLAEKPDELRNEQSDEAENNPRLRFEAPLRNGLKSILVLCLLALMARGSLFKHHLRREDSEVTSSSALNEIVLNPLWTLDKVRQ
jgi:hypothetical protein